MKKINVKIKSTTNKVPIYKTEGACGFDLQLDRIPSGYKYYISGKTLETVYRLSKSINYILDNKYKSKSEKEKLKNRNKIIVENDFVTEINNMIISRKTFDSLVSYFETNDLQIDKVKTYYILYPNESVSLPTPYSIQLPKGYEMEIRPRSSTAINTKLYMHNGTIDSDYRGIITLIFLNFSNDIHILCEGQSYSQGIIRKTTRAKFKIGKLNETKRGERGFGSTGL
jgi:dUTP pyrophosphatase